MYITLAGLMAFSLLSCGAKPSAQPDDSVIPSTSSQETSVPETSGAAESTVSSVAEVSSPDSSAVSDLSAADLSGADLSGADLSASGDTSSVAEAAISGTPAPAEPITQKQISLTDDLEFAQFSKIHSDPAILYENHRENSNGITICVNAGHGTNGGESERTQCHPDGTPKVTGGSTSEGSTTAMAVASGMTFLDGTEERAVTLPAAIFLKDRLLDAGYNVLMIRETEDVQLDNIARTVLANNYAQAHVALHWDSTESDKGAYYMKVPSVDSYKSMYPVSETWEKSDAFGDCLVEGLRQAGRTIYETGSIEMDLTQTSYSKVPSIDIELGDRASDHSDEQLQNIAEGLLMGINSYFGIGGVG